MFSDKRIMAFIPARAGSKRCPGKNHKILHGKPMTSWSIEGAFASKLIDDVFLSTNDPNLYGMAQVYPALHLLHRDESLCADSTTTEDVLIDAFTGLTDQYDYCVLLQATSPLRTAEDIDNALTLCIEAGAASCASFVEQGKPAGFYFGEGEDGLSRLSDFERVLLINGAIYVFRIKDFLEGMPLVNSATLAYLMPLDRSIDIDTPEDFEQAERLIRIVA